MNYSEGHPWHYISTARGGEGITPKPGHEIGVGVRGGSGADLLKYYLGKISKDPQKRNKALKEKLKSCQSSLKRDVKIYENYRINGIRVLSRDDVEIASGGDAELALAVSLSLKNAHVSYNNVCIQELQKIIGGSRQQLSLF